MEMAEEERLRQEQEKIRLQEEQERHKIAQRQVRNRTVPTPCAHTISLNILIKV